MPATQFKRGQTFSYAGQILNNGAVMSFAGWQISAQLRSNYGRQLVQQLTTRFVDPGTGLVEISATDEQTAAWPVQILVMDVRLEDAAGQVVLSDTLVINVVERVTYA